MRRICARQSDIGGPRSSSLKRPDRAMSAQLVYSGTGKWCGPPRRSLLNDIGCERQGRAQRLRRRRNRLRGDRRQALARPGDHTRAAGLSLFSRYRLLAPCRRPGSGRRRSDAYKGDARRPRRLPLVWFGFARTTLKFQKHRAKGQLTHCAVEFQASHDALANRWLTIT